MLSPNIISSILPNIEGSFDGSYVEDMTWTSYLSNSSRNIEISQTFHPQLF